MLRMLTGRMSQSSPDRSQLSAPQTGPPTKLPAPQVCHLSGGHVGQHPGTGQCWGQRGALAGTAPCTQHTLLSPSRWANPQGKEALLRSSCLHSSQMGFAIKSKLNSHCSFPPWSWQTNILLNTDGSQKFVAGLLTPSSKKKCAFHLGTDTSSVRAFLFLWWHIMHSGKGLFFFFLILAFFSEPGRALPRASQRGSMSWWDQSLNHWPLNHPQQKTYFVVFWSPSKTPRGHKG